MNNDNNRRCCDTVDICDMDLDGLAKTPTTTLSHETILNEKEMLNEFLNRGMRELYETFGNSEDLNIQSLIHTKLNELKMMVRAIEDAANKEHMKVDIVCDQKQKENADQEKKEHNKIEKEKQKMLEENAMQYSKWSQEQTAQKIKNANLDSSV